MRKKREVIEGAAYHVTSRTNDRKRVFECNAGRKTMPLVLENAKEKFGFRLANFCIMPTRIHLLIISGEGGNLSQIMRWIKTHSAKRWNRIHGSTDHLWGERYFARPVKDPREYFYVMDYTPLGMRISPGKGPLQGIGRAQGRSAGETSPCQQVKQTARHCERGEAIRMCAWIASALRASQ